ncbi:MAG: lipid-A-disaccharide synthase [Candidatus Latescibacterota bacterium]
MATRPKILISCGEASGDLHASVLVRELLRRIPDANIIAMGGDRVAAAGANVLFHIDQYAMMGFSDVLLNLGRFIRLERNVKRILRDGVDLFIPVDYPGLNLRLAAYAKKMQIPVLYYISPQIWAWGGKRIDKIARTVDRMAVILPFEEDIYRRQGIPVDYVGHPFVEDHTLSLPMADGERDGIGLLPGSRPQEVRRILPCLLDAARHIEQQRAGSRFVIGRNPSVPIDIYRAAIERAGMDVTIDDDAMDVMRRSKVILVASGTATLQGALLGTPLVIVYRVSMFNYLLARRMVKIQNIGLVNIIFGQKVCPEFIQDDAKGESIGRAALQLIDQGSLRRSMIEQFHSLRDILSGGGGGRRVAEIAQELIKR